MLVIVLSTRMRYNLIKPFALFYELKLISFAFACRMSAFVLRERLFPGERKNK
jgi:hypothetical protein